MSLVIDAAPTPLVFNSQVVVESPKVIHRRPHPAAEEVATHPVVLPAFDKLIGHCFVAKDMDEQSTFRRPPVTFD